MQIGIAWECSCGEVVYAEESPEECDKCGNLDSYLKMPEEIIKTREEEVKNEDVDPIKKSKTIKTTKAKGRKK